MAELFIELRSEEIPARMQVKAATDFGKLVTDRLTAQNLSFGSVQTHSTPRRLVLVVEGLPTQQDDRREEKKGPKVGAPEQALAGFLRGAGLTSIDDAEIRETPKGDFYFAVNEVKGQATADVLPELIAGAIGALVWPKSMRWGRSTLRWVRPLQSIIAVFDGQTVHGQLAVGDGSALSFGNVSYGHRFMAPQAFEVTDFASYNSQLDAQAVTLDRDARGVKIRAGLDALAAAEGLSLIEDRGLMEEVIGLVEYPVPIMGTIDDAFMELPAEVLTTSMREHQKFFAFQTADGALANKFATVANIEPKDGGAMIRAGNERVLRARLADAVFFWAGDRDKPLIDNLPKLDKIVFHEKLGTVGERVKRIEAVAVEIAEQIGADAALVSRAAQLAKCDLVTGMVYEFPELQGYVGQQIATHQGEVPGVANAIAEHYSPLGPTDSVPKNPVSVAVALAEKLDTLVGFWLIDQKPTGSKDPFALRRAALGIIRLLTENAHDLSFANLEAAAKAAYGKDVDLDLWNFIKDRLSVSLRGEGVRHDVIGALFNASNADDVMALKGQAAVLQSFLSDAQGDALLATYRRATNIVVAEEKKSKSSFDGVALVESAFEAGDAELAALLSDCRTSMDNADYAAQLSAIAALQPPLDAYFEATLINAEDAAVRSNRLALLAQVRSLTNSVADLSQIEGG